MMNQSFLAMFYVRNSYQSLTLWCFLHLSKQKHFTQWKWMTNIHKYSLIAMLQPRGHSSWYETSIISLHHDVCVAHLMLKLYLFCHDVCPIKWNTFLCVLTSVCSYLLFLFNFGCCSFLLFLWTDRRNCLQIYFCV